MLKNIVFVYDVAYLSGGAAKIVIGEAAEAAKRGYQVYFFAGTGPVAPELTANGIHVICLNETHIAKAKNPLAFLKAIWNPNAKKRLTELLRKLPRNETVVHIHGWTKVLSASVFSACRALDVTPYLTLHEYYTVCPNGGLYHYKDDHICRLKPNSLRCYLCNCDKRSYFQKLYRDARQLVQNRCIRRAAPRTVYITELSRRLIQPCFPGSGEGFFLTNHVQISKQDRIAAEQNSTYLFIGRLSEEKGIDLFCEAVTKTGVNAVVIGDGHLSAQYRDRYPGITFTGWLSFEQMLPHIRRARCLIFSSKWYETMGLTIIEMQQYGIPCIVPAECAGSEYVAHGVTGLLYPNGSSDGICEMIRAMEDDGTAKRLSVNFHNALDLSRYSIATHMDGLLKIYNGETT